MPCDRGIGCLERRDFGNDRRVKLQLAIEREIGRKLLGDTRRLLHEGDVVMLCAALGGEREHGDLGIQPRDLLSAVCRSNGALRKSFRRVGGVETAVRKEDDVPVHVLVAAGRRDHHVEAGDRLDAGGSLDDLKSGAQRVRRGVARARDEPVHIPRFEHERAEEGGVLRLLLRLFLRHALRLAKFIKKVCILLQLGRLDVIDDLDAREVRLGISRLDLFGIAEQDDACNLVLNAAQRRFDDALILPLAKDDPALLFACALLQIVHNGPGLDDLSAELF